MIGIDTNILIYARVADSPWYNQASAFLDGLRDNSNVVIAELVLVEYYLALRNPAVLSPALGAAAATAECQSLRKHPRWALVENANVMDGIWQETAQPGFARRRIIDLRLARTLQSHGVTEFATANVGDFEGLGFARVWNPITSMVR
ncbi:MAG TPA: VapC toxin family PIN domain ribonuclease [Candidatus Paceibacterota bacterium]|nr:VapC toxin family PIN domain ribonuclease [Verrucomicrobiota bacterium]HRY51905.1 VapC toxin family PIN domain ribonuclease [Candidatus Paceibacterota bacterium]